VLGVDGGNTKTIALVARIDGTITGIGRDGCRKLGSSMPCPGSFPSVASRHRSASSWSVAPSRSGVRRSLSSRANRQLRTWPSAVGRVRSQARTASRVTRAGWRPDQVSVLRGRHHGRGTEVPILRGVARRERSRCRLMDFFELCLHPHTTGSVSA